MPSPKARRLLPAALLVVAGCGREPAVEPAAEPPASPAPGPGTVRFTEVGRDVGISFVHDAGVDGSYFMPESIGSGGALFDYDGDGDLDVYLVNAGPHGDDRSRTAPNRLFRQEGDGSFVDRTEPAGAGDTGYGMGAAIGDVDNDGDRDIYLTNFGADRLLVNQGDGAFLAAGREAGLGTEAWSTSACFLDFDRDGDLDLFVATYVHYDPPKSCTDPAGRPEYCGPAAFRGVPDLLYRNDGDLTFTEIGAEAGIADRASKGLGVVCADLDGDGRQDVYVANDGERNELWMNRGDGRFEDRSLVMGAGLNLMGEAEASMGIAVGDVDGDLDLDLFLSHLDRETNTLYRNLGEAGFEDATLDAGAGPSSYPYTGFGTAFFDPDLDGDLDLVIANGRVRRGADRTADPVGPADDPDSYWRHYAQPNLLLVNDGQGRFEDRSATAGDLCAGAEVGRGLMIGDLDRDGDPDALVANCSGPARLFRNDSETGRWVSVRPVDTRYGREAEGVDVTVSFGGRRAMSQVLSSYSYLSAVEPVVSFGLGQAERIDRLRIDWPGGGRTELLDLPAGRSYLVRGPG